MAAIGANRRPPTLDVLRLLDSDPRFSVLTSDGEQWIDPYSGRAVPVTGDHRAAARTYLARSGIWQGRQAMTAQQVMAARWSHDLLRLLPLEPRLRIFASDQRGWIDPYNGQLVSAVVRIEGKVTRETIAAMAGHLAAVQVPADAVLLDNATLMVRMRALGLATPARPDDDQTRDIEQAQRVQQRMLADLPNIQGYALAAHYAGVSKVSGDLYDVIMRPGGRWLFVVGDVSGHGMQAAIIVATAMKTLRLLAREPLPLLDLVARFNEEMRPDLMQGQFITLFCAELDPATHRLNTIRAGHHTAVIGNSESEGVVLRRVGGRGPAVGLLDGGTFRASLVADEQILEPGDVFLQWTDGATEATDPDDQPFGDNRLFGSMLTHADQPIQDLVDLIASDVCRFAGSGLADDLTLLALGRPRHRNT